MLTILLWLCLMYEFIADLVAHRVEVLAVMPIKRIASFQIQALQSKCISGTLW
jgi:hypothetical protein